MHQDSKHQKQEFHGPREVGGSGSGSAEHFVQCESELEFYCPLQALNWTDKSEFMWNSSLLAGTWIEHLIQALEVKQLVRSHRLLGCVWRYEE